MTALWRILAGMFGAWPFGAVLIVLLSACQQSPAAIGEHTVDDWHVIEMTGEGRIEDDQSYHFEVLSSGDRITGDHRVSTGRSAQVILARGDMQLTLSGETSIVLPIATSIGAIAQDYGILRARLKTAANAAKQISTPHLTASGTNAVLTIDVGLEQSTIKVEHGQAVLATTQGDQQARLIEGASARSGPLTGGRLEIRPFDSAPFKPNREQTGQSENPAAGPSHHIQGFLSAIPATSSPPARPRYAQATNLPQTNRATTRMPPSEDLDDQRQDRQLRTQQQHEPDSRVPIPAATHRPRAPLTIQQRFDRLTEGLLVDLPTRKDQDQRAF